MTISSEVDISNLALSMLNVKRITSIATPTTNTEELLSLWYDNTRRQALRRHPWNFAGKRIILAPDAVEPIFGYQAQFTLPSDYIRIMYLNDSVQDRDTPLPSSGYTVENGKILVGNLNSETLTQLQLVYVSDFENVPQMDAMFIDYFATLLAQNIAYNVTQQNSAVERVNALMDQAERRARAMDGQENPTKRVQRSRAINARRSLGAFQDTTRIRFD